MLFATLGVAGAGELYSNGIRIHRQLSHIKAKLFVLRHRTFIKNYTKALLKLCYTFCIFTLNYGGARYDKIATEKSLVNIHQLIDN